LSILFSILRDHGAMCAFHCRNALDIHNHIRTFFQFGLLKITANQSSVINPQEAVLQTRQNAKTKTRFNRWRLQE